MGKLRTKIDYENLRNARILENQARLASLGLQKTISDHRAIASSMKSGKNTVRKYSKKVFSIKSLRRSDRLKQITADSVPQKTCFRRSSRLAGKSLELLSSKEENVVAKMITVDGKSGEEIFGSGGEEKRPANAPLVQINGWKPQLSPEGSARRCHSKGRGSVYDPVFGICCHFCSSLCLKKRKMAPTGLAIYRAREMGHKSVAHLLMNELQKANKLRRQGCS